jgi:hypothetical protein
VLFHVFHTPAIPAAAKAICGMSPDRFRTLRNGARSPVAIGATGATSRARPVALPAAQKAQLFRYINRAFRTPEQQIAFLCRPH